MARTDDLATLKETLHHVWSAGDYGEVAKALELGSQDFLARIPVEPGARVLDLACGTGQLALPLARAGARVTGIDIAEPQISKARARATAEGLDIRFEVGDAEDISHDDGAFDLVISLIGAMFAPRPERAAAEMLRVCRPGGRIVMGNWTADGFVGGFFRAVAAHAPPPDIPSPLLWGDPDTVRQRLGPGCREVTTTPCPIRFRYDTGPAGVAAHYACNFGPVVSAMEGLDGAGRKALLADLEALWADANQAAEPEHQTIVDAELLEVIATRS